MSEHRTEAWFEAYRVRVGAAGRVVRNMAAEDDAPKPTESKYKNKKVQTEEASFASEKEHRRYQELKLLEKAGVIRGLELQKRFVLAEGYECYYYDRKVPPLRYFADFAYDSKNTDGNWSPTVEDCKGFRTGVYKIKRHLMFTVHGIRILET